MQCLLPRTLTTKVLASTASSSHNSTATPPTSHSYVISTKHQSTKSIPDAVPLVQDALPFSLTTPAALSIVFRTPCVPCIIALHPEGTSPHKFTLQVELVHDVSTGGSKKSKSSFHLFPYSKYDSFPHKSTPLHLIKIDQRNNPQKITEIILSGDFEDLNLEIWGLSEPQPINTFKLENLTRKKDIREEEPKKHWKPWYNDNVYSMKLMPYDALFAGVTKSAGSSTDPNDPADIFQFEQLHGKIHSLAKYHHMYLLAPYLLSRLTCFLVLNILQDWNKCDPQIINLEQMNILIELLESDMFSDDTDSAIGYTYEFQYDSFDIFFFMKMRLEVYVSGWVHHFLSLTNNGTTETQLPSHKVEEIVRVFKLLNLILQIEPMVFEDSQSLLRNIVRVLYAPTEQGFMPLIVVQHALILLIKLIEIPSAFFLLQGWKPKKDMPFKEKDLVEFIGKLREKFGPQQGEQNGQQNGHATSQCTTTLQLIDLLHRRKAVLECFCASKVSVTEETLAHIVTFLHQERILHYSGEFYAYRHLNQCFSNEQYPFVSVPEARVVGELYTYHPHIAPLNFLFVANAVFFHHTMRSKSMSQSTVVALIVELLKNPIGLSCISIHFSSVTQYLMECIPVEQRASSPLLQHMDFTDFRPLHMCRASSNFEAANEDIITPEHALHLVYAHVVVQCLLDTCHTGKDPVDQLSHLYTLTSVPIFQCATVYSLLSFSRGNVFLKMLKSSIDDKHVEHACIKLLDALLCSPLTCNQEVLLLRFSASLRETLATLAKKHPDSLTIKSDVAILSEQIRSAQIHSISSVDSVWQELQEMLFIFRAHRDGSNRRCDPPTSLFILHSLSQCEEFGALLLEYWDVVHHFLGVFVDYLSFQVLDAGFSRTVALTHVDTALSTLGLLLSVLYNMLKSVDFSDEEVEWDVSNTVSLLIRVYVTLAPLPGFSYCMPNTASQVDAPQSAVHMYICRRMVLNSLHWLCVHPSLHHIGIVLCEQYEKEPLHSYAYTELFNDLLVEVFASSAPHACAELSPDAQNDNKPYLTRTYHDRWMHFLDEDEHFLNVMRVLSKEENIVVHQSVLNVYFNICKISPLFVQKYTKKVIGLLNVMLSDRPSNPLILRTLNMAAQMLRHPAFVIIAHKEHLMSTLIPVIAHRMAIPIVNSFDGSLIDILTDSTVQFFDIQPLVLLDDTSNEVGDITEPPLAELYDFFNALSSLFHPNNLQKNKFLLDFASDLLKRMTTRYQKCALLMMKLAKVPTCFVQIDFLFTSTLTALDETSENLKKAFNAPNLKGSLDNLRILECIAEVAKNMLITIIDYDKNMLEKRVQAHQTVSTYVQTVLDNIQTQRQIFQVHQSADFTLRQEIIDSFRRVFELIQKIPTQIILTEDIDVGTRMDLHELWSALEEKGALLNVHTETASHTRYITLQAPSLDAVQRPIYNVTTDEPVPAFVLQRLERALERFEMHKDRIIKNMDRHEIAAKRSVTRFEERNSTTRKKHQGIHVDDYMSK